MSVVSLLTPVRPKEAIGDKRSGTQSVERAILILKELASRSSFGWRLSDLAERCDVDAGTLHRILACLVKERLAQQRSSDRHYLPGPLLFELGLSQPSLTAFQLACEAPVRRIAKKCGALATIYLRSGTDFVCSSVAGASTVKALSSGVGTRRPLIVSAGGIAILMELRKTDAKAIVADNLRRVAHLGAPRVKALKLMLANSERCGYGVHIGEVVPGVNMFGVAIHDHNQTPFASLCIAGASEVLPENSAAQLVDVLRAEAKALERQAAPAMEERVSAVREKKNGS